MKLAFYIVDAFTDQIYSGNPAGVVFHDGSLTNSQMQAIAGELHLETAFVSPPGENGGDYAVAYYTSECRIPLCGHDTVALGVVLREQGIYGSVTFRTDIGIVPVQISQDGWVTMQQAIPEFGAVVDPHLIAAALGCSLEVLSTSNLPSQIVSTGSPFLFVPLPDRPCVDGLNPVMSLLTDFLNRLPGAPLGCYVWSLEDSHDHTIYSRCFCPGVGLPEDPVTGSASGALGAYLCSREILKPNAGEASVFFKTRQGSAMGRPGSARVEIHLDEKSNIDIVKVSGQGVLTAHGKAKMP